VATSQLPDDGAVVQITVAIYLGMLLLGLIAITFIPWISSGFL
jgi:hypothetical protein